MKKLFLSLLACLSLAGPAFAAGGGVPMLDPAATKPSGLAIAADARSGTALGKRYVNASGDLELLCTKPGEGSLSVAGVPLVLKEAKALPSSD